MICPSCKADSLKTVAKGHYKCEKCGEEFLTNDSDYLKMIGRILDEDY